MRTAALLALIATAALAQVDVLQSGTSKGKFNHMNFTGCTVVGDAGWSTIACSGGGTTPTGVCLDGGNALAWDGGAFACTDVVKAGSCSAGQVVAAISTSGVPTCVDSNPWVTAFDCTFSDSAVIAAANPTPDSPNLHDAGWTLCGTVVRVWRPNQDFDGGFTLVSGNGIVIHPRSATSNGASPSADFTDTGIYIDLPNIISGLNWNTPLRSTVYAQYHAIATGTMNGLATFEHITNAFMHYATTGGTGGEGKYTSYQAIVSYRGGANDTTTGRALGTATTYLQNGSTGVYDESAWVAATNDHQIMVNTLPDGYSGGQVIHTADLPDGGTFPSASPRIHVGTKFAVGTTTNVTASYTPVDGTPTGQSLRAFIGVGRAGATSGGAAGNETYIYRWKIEYRRQRAAPPVYRPARWAAPHRQRQPLRQLALR